MTPGVCTMTDVTTSVYICRQFILSLQLSYDGLTYFRIQFACINCMNYTHVIYYQSISSVLTGVSWCTFSLINFFFFFNDDGNWNTK